MSFAAQAHPLKVNPQSGEVFLPLRNHPNIILTPPRSVDGPASVGVLNDDLVHPYLAAPPYPYLPEDADRWIPIATAMSNEVLEEIKAGPPGTFVNGCPLQVIREVHEDGTDTFIGNISFSRSNDMDLSESGLDKSLKDSLNEENKLKKSGDPTIVWTIGDFLGSKYHGKGIMTDAVATLINDWAIPRMNAKKILILAFAGNLGSVKVFLKNGFTLRPEVAKDHQFAKGELKSLHVLDWTRVE